MNAIIRLVAPLAALAVLASCDKAKGPAAKTSAEGQILEGSVSDAMLPLDTVRSQAPLAPRGEGSESASGAGTAKDQRRIAGGGKPETKDEPATNAAGDPPAAGGEAPKPDAE